MMRLLWILGCGVVSLGFNARAGEEIVQITATLVPVDQVKVEGLTQVELKKELFVARNKGAEKLLQLSAVVESGKWASIRQGREFWYPQTYSDAKVYKADSDKIEYSVPVAGSSFSNFSVVLPTSPTAMQRIDLGPYLKVRPTVKEDGLIYIEGELKDVVFEGLSEEALPITANTGQLIKGKKEHEILVSRIDKPLFHRFDKKFGVMLPVGSGNTESAKRFRNAQSKYDYLIPVELGDNVFGAHGTIDIGTLKSDKKGIIRSTVDKATSKAEIIKDVLVRKKDQPAPTRRNAILILEVKKITSESAGLPVSGANQSFRIESTFVESSEPLDIESPVMTLAEFQKITKPDAKKSPVVVVRSGQSGTVTVAREFVFPTLFEDPKAIAAINSENATPLEFETRLIGTNVEVTATSRGNNRIGLKLNVTTTQFEGMVNYGNPIMQLKTGGLVKKIKPTVKSKNAVSVPVFPFRGSETEMIVPNDSVVAVTMVHDRFNIHHEKNRLLKIGQPKTEELTVARYLTVFLHARAQ